MLAGDKKPAAQKPESKAQKALKAVKKGIHKKHRKPKYNTTFHRPKTLKHTRAPKYPRWRWESAVQQAQQGCCSSPLRACLTQLTAAAHQGRRSWTALQW